MKKLVVFVFAVAISMGAVAQQQNELEMFQSMYKIEKKALLMDFLKLSDEEAKVFWPIYEAYESERGKNANRRIELLKKYADEFSTLTNEQADELVVESFKVRATVEKLHKAYYKKVKKDLGAIRAAQFVQFERYVQTALNSQLDDSIPLIGEKL